MYIENGSLDHIATLRIDENEWDILRTILLEGVGLFQDNEAEIKVYDQDSVPAYLEGV
jgi:hypothetical protein